MKKLTNIIIPILFLVFKAQHLHAQENHKEKKKYEFVRKNNIQKTYTVSQNQKLSIANSFGDVTIHTWQKNEIKLNIQVEVTANSEKHAQNIFDKIIIKDAESKNEISYKTKIEATNNFKNDKNTLAVDYEIWMPENNELSISNDFGDITLPDYKGIVDLTSKFGNLKTGELLNAKKINVEFGKISTEGLHNANVIIKFSKANLGKLCGDANLKIEFSGVNKISLAAELRSLNLQVNYSTVNIKPDSELQASYHVKTNFGDFKNRSNIKFYREEDADKKGPKFDFEYNAKTGNGQVPIKVKASFGNIIMGEATEQDLEEKKKSNSKKQQIEV